MGADVKARLERVPFFSDAFRETFLLQLSGLKTAKASSDYIGRVEAVCRASGEKDFLELTREDALTFFRRDESRNERTKFMFLSTFRSVARFADGRLGTNVLSSFSDIQNVQAPEMQYRVSDIDPPERVARFLSFLREKNDQQLFTILALIIETGLSGREICRLTFDNFLTSEPQGIPIIRFEPETNEAVARVIPLTAKTAALVDEVGRKNQANKNYPQVFRNRFGKPLDVRVLELAVRNMCLEAKTFYKNKGIEIDEKDFVTLQSLRTMSSVNMAAGGAEVKALADQLGVYGTWFGRIYNVAQHLPKTAAVYNHLKVEW